MRVFVPAGLAARRPAISRRSSSWPPGIGVQVRHLRPSVPTLEDVFAQGDRRRIDRPCRSTIRATGATAAARRSPGRSWTVIAWAGIRTHAPQARVHGRCLIFAWLPFVVRAVQIYVVHQLPAGARCSPPTAETFRQFLEQQDFFVFIVTIYVGAGLIANDRRANALQIYLSKPLMRIGIHRRQAAVLFDVPAARDARAGDAAAVAAGACSPAASSS